MKSTDRLYNRVFVLLMWVLAFCGMAGLTAEVAVPITWKTLTDVTFRERFNIRSKGYDKIPSFGTSVRELEGKRVLIKGYMIPVSLPDDIYVISAQPMSSCFFCGAAGPETLMELQFREKPRRFKTDEIRTLSGMLELNRDDTERLFYRLTSTEVAE